METREREREKNKTSTKCGAESAACHDDDVGCRKAEIKRFFLCGLAATYF